MVEWLAFNFALDKALGVLFNPSRWPYSAYKPEGVETFLEPLSSTCIQEGQPVSRRPRKAPVFNVV